MSDDSIAGIEVSVFPTAAVDIENAEKIVDPPRKIHFLKRAKPLVACPWGIRHAE